MLDVPGAVTRFSREARAAAKIKNEHVARVTDVGELENGTPYMVMEYLEGEDLAAWLTQRGPLSLQQAATLVLQACEALVAAHQLGIVHRDLKPANLFVTRRPNGSQSLKVLDFGISKMDADVAMTQTSVVLGSPLYMSPEQLRSSKDVDARADIWSIGVILYQLLSGYLPFEGTTIAEVVAQVLECDPIPPTERCPDLPIEIETAISKCLTKDRDDRYQSINELAAVLARFAAPDENHAARRNITVACAASVTPGPTVTPRGNEHSPIVEAAPTKTSWERSHSMPLSRKSKVIALVSVAVLLGAVVIGKLLMSAPSLGSVGPAQSVNGTSNASVIGGPGSIQSPSEFVPAPTVTAARGQTVKDTSPATAEHIGTKKRIIPAVTSAGPKPEATTAPSVVPTSTSHESHPFDDRK
jgi:serine/threonine-protein kinase